MVTDLLQACILRHSAYPIRCSTAGRQDGDQHRTGISRRRGRCSTARSRRSSPAAWPDRRHPRHRGAPPRRLGGARPTPACWSRRSVKKTAPPPLPAAAASPTAPPLTAPIAPTIFSSAPVAPMAPPLSPLSPSGGGPKTKPPPLPAATAPAAPPMAPPGAPDLSAPSAPPMAPPPPAAGASIKTAKPSISTSSPDSKDALLAAIRQGKKMKRIGPPKEKSLAERMGQA